MPGILKKFWGLPGVFLVVLILAATGLTALAVDSTPPAIPTGLIVTDPGTGSHLILTWDANTEEDLAGYLVLRGYSNSGKFEQVTPQVITGNSYNDSVQKNVPYIYRVVAIDVGETQSAPSGIASGMAFVNSIQNGNYASDFAGWNPKGDLPQWIASGYLGTLALAGKTNTGQGGAVKWEVAAPNKTVSGYVYQQVVIKGAQAFVRASFAWAKFAVNTPILQRISLRVLGSGQNEAMEVWSDADKTADLPENNAVWNRVEDLDLSSYFKTPGVYSIQMLVELDNGPGNNSQAGIMVDEITVSERESDLVAPSSPTGLEARDTRRGGMVNLEWHPNKEDDVVGYYVYRNKDGGAWQQINAASVASVVYQDKDLDNGVNYGYQITAVDRWGNESPPSQEVAVVPTLDTTPPVIPRNLDIKPRREDIALVLNWEPNTEADLGGYLLFRGDSLDRPFRQMNNQPLSGKMFADNSIIANTTYYYRIAAMDDIGNTSAMSSIVSDKVDTIPPAVPGGVNVENPGTGEELHILWTTNNETDLAGYAIYRSTKAEGPFNRIGSITESVYIDESVERNASYWYRIDAFDRVGNNSNQSEPIMGQALDTKPPLPPKGTNIDDLWTGSELQVNWLPNIEEDLRGYNLYRATGSEGVFQRINNTPLLGTSFIDTDLNQGQTYRYRVTALDTSGNESEPLMTMSARPFIGSAMSSINPQGVIPARLRLELSASAMFVGDSQSSIQVKAVAEDTAGAEVSVSGTWRYATDFNRFQQLTLLSPAAVNGYFRSNVTGEADIIVEFIPDQPGAAPVRAVSRIRVLDWRVDLEVSGDQTATGGDDLTLTATITDQKGLPVTDPAAQVIFQVGHSNKVSRALKENPIVGRYQGDGRVVAFDLQGLPAEAGQVDARGQARGKLIASTIPGKNWLTAVLQYRDQVVLGAPTMEVATSQTETITVEKGSPSYVAWAPGQVAVIQGEIYEATVNAFDSFGNVTHDYGNLEISIQSPNYGHVDFSTDEGMTWFTDYDWHPVTLGSRLMFRLAGDASWLGAYGYLVVRIDRGAGRLSAPPGVNQVNMPLLLLLK